VSLIESSPKIDKEIFNISFDLWVVAGRWLLQIPYRIGQHLEEMRRRVSIPSAPFLLYSIAEGWRFQKCPYSLSPERDRVNAMFFVFN